MCVKEHLLPLAGTLSYLFNTFKPGMKFSDVIRDAKVRGRSWKCARVCVWVCVCVRPCACGVYGICDAKALKTRPPAVKYKYVLCVLRGGVVNGAEASPSPPPPLSCALLKLLTRASAVLHRLPGAGLARGARRQIQSVASPSSHAE